MFISTAYAQAAGAPSATESLLVNILPIVMIVAIMYFLILRPQQQRLKAHQAMVGGLKRGDVVVTGGGIVGKVIKVMETDEILVEIAEDVRIKVIKSTVADVRSKTEPVASDSKSSKIVDEDN
jgi:preprotein translocase subunit YajC